MKAHVYMRVRVFVCVRMCISGCAYARSCKCMSACLRAHVQMCTLASLHKGPKISYDRVYKTHIVLYNNTCHPLRLPNQQFNRGQSLIHHATFPNFYLYNL